MLMPSSTVMLVIYSRLLDTYATSLASCQKESLLAVKVARKSFCSTTVSPSTSRQVRFCPTATPYCGTAPS